MPQIHILLNKKRTENNIKLVPLSKMCGIGKSTLNNIENGVTSPTLDELLKIANALDCSIYDLFNVTE